jgi:hypothetical protein
MPYKDPEVKRKKNREYQAAYREKVKQQNRGVAIQQRFCKVCDINISRKRKDAIFCSRKHKALYADSQKNYAELYEKNKEIRKKQALSYYYKNLTVSRAKQKERQKKNLHIYAANSAKRRAAKLLRTPKWLTKDDLFIISEAYKLAALRSNLLGFPWHVDHVVPLQGKTVSGLHVPWNLQVIPASMNIAKHNLFEVA